MSDKLVFKSLDELKPYKNNPRFNDNAVDSVASSIKEFGFKVPIVIDKNGVIVAGHTRYKASKKLGLETVPCIIADDLTDKQVKAFRLVDNKTSELAEWDFVALEKELESIAMDLDKMDIDMNDFTFDLTDPDDQPEEDPKYDYSDGKLGSLEDKFVVPPFSILDSRQGYWQERKRKWRDLIGDNAEARSDAKAYQVALNGMTTQTSILDPVLSEIITRWFTPLDGNNCFDCFAGDTVFGFVSSSIGKNFTGIELRQEQVDFNTSRVKAHNLNAVYHCDDGRNVGKYLEPKSQDLFFSCPPYYDLEVYSDLPNDASNQETYEDFYAILDTAFTESLKCLKDNRFAVVVASDIRDKKGAYYDFCGDIRKTFERNGAIYYNDMILINSVGTGALRANRSMNTRKVIRLHQNVMVFYKGNPSKISELFGNVEVGDIEGKDE